MDEKNITRLQNPIGASSQGIRKLRTVVYARVSTEKECQELSLEAQMTGFTKLINDSPNMVLAGIYADEGVTGTSVCKRKQFLQMIEDGEKGKFDTVITKSISRFARNTVQCLEYVRHLKALGINVVFVKENIDTANIMSEMLLTVLSAFAQEESRSISENLKWGIRKRYEMGEGRWSATYGYRCENKKVVIEEAEARIVRRIFDSYIKGISSESIARQLNQERVLSPRGKQWTKTTIKNILRSEKYIGDVQLQKYITVDHISHKSVRNDMTEVPSYYVKNSHEAIIDRRSYEQVQRILELKAPRDEVSRYPYEDTNIICPLCGEKLVTRLMHVQKEKKAVCCFGERGCGGFAVKTWMLEQVILSAFDGLNEDKIEGNGDAANRLRKQKREGTPKTVEYGFLADTVDKISFKAYKGTRIQKHKKRPATIENICDWDVIIQWQCGLMSTVPLPLDSRYTEEPGHVAEMYRRYLERIRNGEYVPTRPKNQRERKMKAAQLITSKEEAEIC